LAAAEEFLNHILFRPHAVYGPYYGTESRALEGADFLRRVIRGISNSTFLSLRPTSHDAKFHNKVAQHSEVALATPFV